MAKMTKTQQKRAYEAILSKATKLWLGQKEPGWISTTDYMAIEKICRKYLKKF